MSICSNRLACWGLMLSGLSLLTATTGCNMLAMMGYVAHEDNIDPEYKKLEGKRVAVVCRPVEQLQYADAGAAPDLANLVSERLTKNVKKCNVVRASEVSEWADEHNWQEFSEVGKAVKADYVVGIELEQFSLDEGQTLLKGRADIHIFVYDMKKGGQKVWDKKIPSPELVYPPNSAVADRSPAEFRQQYLEVLADHVARNFYPYDKRADFCAETNVLN